MGTAHPSNQGGKAGDLYAEICGANARLVGPDGRTQALPSTLGSFLGKLLAELKDGRAVTILENDAALTTVKASRLLGMSRQFLIGLLEKGEIPFHMVGSHRRLYVRDVLVYKAKRDAGRRKSLNHLARREAKQGTYDRLPNDFGVNTPEARR